MVELNGMKSNAIKHIQHWIDSRLEKRESSIQGNGIFTTRAIEKGIVVMKWGGDLFTMEQVKEGKAKLDSLSGYSKGKFLGQPINEEDSTMDQFLNHSCEPNLWMIDKVRIAARRNIESGEELTIDYALFELDDNWVMPELCNCGSSECRSTITGRDWQLESVQKKYRGHFLPYINNQIEKLKLRSALF